MVFQGLEAGGMVHRNLSGSLTSQAVELIGCSKQNLFKTHQAFCLILFPCPERSGAKSLGAIPALGPCTGHRAETMKLPAPSGNHPPSPLPSQAARPLNSQHIDHSLKGCLLSTSTGIDSMSSFILSSSLSESRRSSHVTSALKGC